MAGGEAQAERGFDTYFIHHHTVYELDWRLLYFYDNNRKYTVGQYILHTPSRARGPPRAGAARARAPARPRAGVLFSFHLCSLLDPIDTHTLDTSWCRYINPGDGRHGSEEYTNNAAPYESVFATAVHFGQAAPLPLKATHAKLRGKRGAAQPSGG